MKNILLIFVLVLPFFGFVSDKSAPKDEQFRIDYRYISAYTEKAGKWSEWKEASNTFVFNCNSRNDIMHLKAGGQNVIYKKISSIKEGKTASGEPYQTLDAIDEEGIRFTLHLYEDEEIGLKMSYSNLSIQFAN